MKSGFATVVVLGFACAAGSLVFAGCSDDPPPAAATDTGTSGPCDLKDEQDPPVACSPELSGATKCDKIDKVATCPDNECAYQVKQSGDIVNLRMGRIRLWAPEALLSLAPIAVDPNVNQKCASSGGESFTWLMQIDKKAKRIKTGGSKGSPDSKVFAFVNETVDASKLEAICPGFKGPSEPINLAPIESDLEYAADGSFATKQIPLINIPIFSDAVPVILPIREGILKKVTVSADGNCIGKYNKNFWCDRDTLGWTTGGQLVGKMLAEDADRVPVKSAGCQSLCALLANDPKLTEKGVCKRGPDGKVPEIGNTCVGGTTCKNAFVLSASLAAYGVSIVGSIPTDGGTDGSTDTGTTDAATDSAPADATTDATADGG